jgi:hypothetical protein
VNYYHLTPDYTVINRRIHRLYIKIKGSKDKEFQYDYLIIAIDNIGVKVTDRCQWMREKEHIKKQEKDI